MEVRGAWKEWPEQGPSVFEELLRFLLWASDSFGETAILVIQVSGGLV